MGNTQSEEQSFKRSEESSISYCGFVPSDQGLIIKKECFLIKFQPSLNELGEALWERFSHAKDFMTLSAYEDIIHHLDNGTEKLSLFIDCITYISPYIYDYCKLFSWFNLGRSLDDALLQSLLKAIQQNKSIDLDAKQLENRLSVLFPDIADDLSKVVSHLLTRSEPVLSVLNVFSNPSPLLNEGIFWLLSVVLSSPFKRYSSTVLYNSAPLEYENLKHIQCLYTSFTHGFSLTRIKELAFDYKGPVIMLFQTAQNMFCLCSDEGLRDSLRPYGSREAKLFRILPIFSKLVSGRSATLAKPGTDTGIIYSNFTAKTARQGFMVGHQPVASPALEVTNGFTELCFAGSPLEKLLAVEIWAAGSPDQLEQLSSQKMWELQQVNKAKNRKIKLDEDWRESSDRVLLDLAGVQVRYSDTVEPHEDK